jgi:anhydro-N-acetylmuramic acid kinase
MSGGDKLKILGMMSGTSFDGIDSALCEFTWVDDEVYIKLLNFESVEYSTDLRKLIVDAMPPRKTSMQIVCELDTLIGQSFAKAASENISKSGYQPDLIVSHGQTMFHWIDMGHKARGTLQLGEATWIAEATGVQVLSNIRSRDVAAGGQGAPLVSILDHLLLSDSKTPQGALNLGGISNITVTSSELEPVAYDIGPANGLMDAAIQAFSNGKKSYDDGGSLASAGKINQKQLKLFLEHPYYKLSAPKSTGKEIFHLPYIIEVMGDVENWKIEDVLATLLELTVETVAIEVEKFKLTSLYVAGGGARNPQLMKRLQERLPNCKVLMMTELGISTQSKEAIAFALIGFLTVNGLPGQIPSCTGASGNRLLGTLTPGANPINVPKAVENMPIRVRIVE